jgi:hypothetical protein
VRTNAKQTGDLLLVFGDRTRNEFPLVWKVSLPARADGQRQRPQIRRRPRMARISRIRFFTAECPEYAEICGPRSGGNAALRNRNGFLISNFGLIRHVATIARRSGMCLTSMATVATTVNMLTVETMATTATNFRKMGRFAKNQNLPLTPKQISNRKILRMPHSQDATCIASKRNPIRPSLGQRPNSYQPRPSA